MTSAGVGLPVAADTLTRAADLIEKQPIGAFAEAARRAPGRQLAAAMKSAASYLDDEGAEDAYSMAVHLLTFARRLLREEESTDG